jgi:hypothetical protein
VHKTGTRGQSACQGHTTPASSPFMKTMKKWQKWVICISAVIVGLCFFGVALSIEVYFWRSDAAFNRVAESDVRALLCTQRASVEALKEMVIQDASRSPGLRIAIDSNGARGRGNISEKRQSEYLALFSRLGVIGVKGETDAVLIFMAHTGWAGDTKGKVLYWQSPNSSSRVLTAHHRETVKISDDGWWYVYYW